MLTDFQFLADTELNFDPQYDSPCSIFLSLSVVGSLKDFLEALTPIYFIHVVFHLWINR